MQEAITLAQAKANLDHALAELAAANAKYEENVLTLARDMKDFLAGADEIPSTKLIKAFLSRSC